MFFGKIREFLNQLASGNLSFKEKIFWWNGLQSEVLDKSFRWDEWTWFGIVPALAPYLFYIIWKKKD